MLPSESMPIKANPDLYYRLTDISNRTLSLRGIIQNDMEVSRGDLNHWNRNVLHLIQDLESLRIDILKYIIK